MSNVKIIELLKGIRVGIETKTIEVNDSVLQMLNNIGVNVQGIKMEIPAMPITMPTSTLVTDAPHQDIGKAYILTNNNNR